MAQIRTIERKKGKSFEVRINRKDLEKTMSKSFNNLADARAWANHIEAKIDRGEQVSRKAESFKFSQACADFLAFYKRKNKTGKEEDGKLTTGEIQLVESVNATFKEKMNDPTVSKITHEVLQNYIEGKLKTQISEPENRKKIHPYYNGDKKRTYSPATVRKHFFQIKKILEWHAIREKYALDGNLFKMHNIPNAWTGRRKRRLEEGELELLEAAAKKGYEHQEQWPLLINFALATAARSQEILKAKWSDINTAGRAFNIPAENVKTSTFRQVPLSKKALDILEKMSKFKKENDPRIFHMWRDSATISKGFRRLSQRAGVENFRFHDLRHEAISRLFERTDLSDSEIMSVSGHTNVSTLVGYAHLRASHLASKMDGAGA